MIIWGASGQAIVLEEFVGTLGFDVVAFFDNAPNRVSPISNVPLHHGMDGLRIWLQSIRYSECFFLVAIGGANGQHRISISAALCEAGLSPVSVFHPTAYVAQNSQLGFGAQVLMNASIGARCVIGENCIFNTSSSVDHESRIDDGCHVGPGATLAGLVQLGRNVFIGAGATVLPRVKIGSGTVVGAGSVVTANLPANVVAYGVPAKIVEKNI